MNLEDLELDEDLLPVQEPIRKPVKQLRRTKSIPVGSIRGFIQPDDSWKDAHVFISDPKGDHIYTPPKAIDTSEQETKRTTILRKGMYRGHLWKPPHRRGTWQVQNGVKTYHIPRSRASNFINKKAPLPIGGVSKYRRSQNKRAYSEISSEIYEMKKDARHPRLKALYDAPDRVEILGLSYYPGDKQRLVRWRGPIPKFLIRPIF